MAIQSNGYFNDPNIGSAMGSLAALFAPADGTQMAAMATARATRDKALALEALRSNPNDPDFDKRLEIEGLMTGLNTNRAQEENDATARRGQDKSLEASLSQPMAPNSVRNLPKSVADMYGGESQQTGVLTASPGEVVQPPSGPAIAGAVSTDQAKAAAMKGLSQGETTALVMGETPTTPVVKPDGTTGIDYVPSAVTKGETPTMVYGGERKSFDDAQGAADSKNYADFQATGQQATAKLATLGALANAAKGAGYTGLGGDQVLAVRKAAAALGFDVSKTSDAELLQSLGNTLALQLRNPTGGAGMPGSMSDADRNFLSASVPGLGHTAPGNALLIDYSQRVAKRDVDVAKLAQQYVAQHGVLDGGFTSTLKQFTDANPLFPEAAKGGAPGAPPAAGPSAVGTSPAAAAPARPQSPADFNALPPGSLYVDPGDGKTYRK